MKQESRLVFLKPRENILELTGILNVYYNLGEKDLNTGVFVIPRELFHPPASSAHVTGIVHSIFQVILIPGGAV